MLARANRLTRADDYRRTVRGRRLVSTNTIVYIADRRDRGPSRFGFIVGRSVGNAVIRNTIRRRLRAVCFELVSSTATGFDVVVRALPSSREASWATLQGEVSRAMGRGTVRA